MTIQKFSPDDSSWISNKSNNELLDLSDQSHYSGLLGSADVFLICSLFNKNNKPLFVLVPDSKRADQLYQECSSILGEENVSLFPSRDAIPYNMKSPFGPTVESRFKTLAQLMNNSRKVFIAPSATLMQKLLPQKTLFNKIIRLNTNDDISPETLCAWLVENGFSREALVENIGTFAIRGGILDIYPFISENPIRIEFWGDTIESIREFDIFKQKSIKLCSSVDIFPMSEFCLGDEDVLDALASIKDFCDKTDAHINKYEKLKYIWKSQSDFDGVEWFLHWFSLPYSSILDYLSPECLVVWNCPFSNTRHLSENIANYEKHVNRVADTFRPFVSQPKDLLIPISDIIEDLSTFKQLSINSQPVPENIITENLHLQDQPYFNSSIKLLCDDLKKKETDGFLVTIICENNGHAERIKEILDQENCTAQIVLGSIKNGFINPEEKTAFYSESLIFNRRQRIGSSRKSKNSVPIKSFDTLMPGDHVVHIDHGIAKFNRIEKVQTAGIHQDCMVLLFQNNSKVYVPIEDFHKVQKYIGKDASQPTLSKLGTSRWEKQKEKTKQSLKEMAEKLVKIYAKREYLDGIAFSKDSVWQKEFEDSFIYDITEDQEKVTKDVKKDMESKKPMDRLICGDVGFGKTEVAMRASFKAAIDGHQVAILAPTTILASQHYATFTERMANFPISIAVISRFQKPKEQKEIIKKLIDGKIDIIIGTHRILSKDIYFKNLGLLIVDEEQRFGVKHKEKLKELRYKVDVLSMTATPIPRTLHMSLVGIRDLSIINTPPNNRLPIETHVQEFHEELIQTAIENEIDRGGQVYVVNNRIRSLEQLQETIERIVPQARIVIAHGQMNEKNLEWVMKEFVAGKFDVLLATTIIENGLDIPNVNTIIVSRSDALGLSQLYQLRGRVGRSSEQAFAYFLTKPFDQIKDISLRRLRALEQYTDLGSGFQIAMRDLEIRGAGNILGTDQHGSIAAVGFELYCTLLKEEIDTMLGKEQENVVHDVKIDITLDAYIPQSYIPDSTTRISLYQECSACDTIDTLNLIKNSFVDRFGPLPEPVEALFALIQIKIISQKTGVSHIGISPDNILTLSFHGTDKQVAEKIKTLISSSSRQFEIKYGTPVRIKTRLSEIKRQSKAYETIDILNLI